MRNVSQCRYRDDTSRVTEKSFSGSCPRCSSLLRKCAVSVMNECVVCTKGLRWWSTNCEIRLKGWLLLETMGRPGLPVLCILGKMWKRPGLGLDCIMKRLVSSSMILSGSMRSTEAFYD